MSEPTEDQRAEGFNKIGDAVMALSHLIAQDTGQEIVGFVLIDSTGHHGIFKRVPAELLSQALKKVVVVLDGEGDTEWNENVGKLTGDDFVEVD